MKAKVAVLEKALELAGYERGKYGCDTLEGAAYASKCTKRWVEEAKAALNEGNHDP
jgi:hypothetical protein